MTTQRGEVDRPQCNDGDVVFVVRVRRPTSAVARQEIHGRAEHIKSQTTCYFKNCAALCDFMFRALDAGTDEQKV
jgi:hypothetical protein